MTFSEQDALQLQEEAVRLLDQGLTREARVKAQAALGLFRSSGDRAHEASALNTLGMSYYAEGDLDAALEYLEKALSLRRDVGDREGEGITANNLGLVYHGMGQHEEALQHLKYALGIRREFWDRRGERKTLHNLGIVYRALGQPQTALDGLHEALAGARELYDTEMEGQLLCELADLYRAMSRHEEALESYELTLTAARACGDQVTQQDALNSLGAVYVELGASKRALPLLEEALSLARELGDRQGEGHALHNLSALYRALDQTDKALESATTALELAQEGGQRAFLASALNSVGVAFEEVERYEEALEHYRQSLDIARVVGNQRDALITLANMGGLYAKMGRYAASLASIDEALALARDTGDQDGLGFALYHQAIARRGAGQVREALASFERAIEAVEALRGGLSREHLRIGYLSTLGDLYDGYVELLVDQGDTRRALNAVERGRSRTFVELLGHAAFPTPKVPEEQRALLDNEAALVTQLRALENQVHQTVGDAQRELFRQQRETRGALNDVLARLEAFAPDYVALRRGEPVDYGQIQGLLDRQGVPAALVEFYSLSDEVLIFVVRSGEGEPILVRVPISPVELLRHVENYFREVMDFPQRGDIGERWQALAEPLLANLLPCLKGVELAYLVPHALLHYLPLHALRVDGAFLIDRFPIAYAPSAAVLGRVQGRTTGMERAANGRGALVLGYTPHEDEREVFEREAAHVAEFFGAVPFLGQEATGALLRETSAQYDTLHLSCHGFFDTADPLASGLLLADGVLTAREIMGLTLKADLVTLSACQTGLSGQQPGDELVGLTRALLYAGAQSVLVTLWSVDAVAALDLMDAFYSRLRGQDGAKITAEAVALREAMLEMREREEHPYYWAPFILVGDWR